MLCLRLPHKNFSKIFFASLFFRNLLAPPPVMIQSNSHLESVDFIAWLEPTMGSGEGQNPTSSLFNFCVFSKKTFTARVCEKKLTPPGLLFQGNHQLLFSDQIPIKAVNGFNRTKLALIDQYDNVTQRSLVIFNGFIKVNQPGTYNWYLRGVSQYKLDLSETVNSFCAVEALDKANQTFATGSTDGLVKVWQNDPTKNIYNKTHGFEGFEGEITFLAWSPDEECLAATSAGGSVGVFLLAAFVAPAGAAAAQPAQAGAAAAEGAELPAEIPRRLPQIQNLHRGPVSCMAWSQSSEHLATGSLDHTVKIWNRDGQFMAELLHRDEVLCLAWNFMGWLSTGSKERIVRVWNFAEPTAFETGGMATAAAAESAYSRLRRGSASPRRARLRADCLFEIPHPTATHSLVWYPTGQYLIAGGSNGVAAIWRINDSAAAIVDTLHCEINRPVLCAVWSPDFQELALAAGGVVCIWPISKHYLDELKEGFGVKKIDIRGFTGRIMESMRTQAPGKIAGAALDATLGTASSTVQGFGTGFGQRAGSDLVAGARPATEVIGSILGEIVTTELARRFPAFRSQLRRTRTSSI